MYQKLLYACLYENTINNSTLVAYSIFFINKNYYYDYDYDLTYE